MTSLKDALQRIRSSVSLDYSSTAVALTLVLRADLAFTADRDRCLSFLRRCANYGEIVTASSFPSIVWQRSSNIGASDDLQERIAKLLAEAMEPSTEGAACTRGLSSSHLIPFDGSC